MQVIEAYRHHVASHCETGSVRNLLIHAGLEISEPMVFGIGSGPAFYYLFFAKGPNGMPMVGIRNPPGSILKNVGKHLLIDVLAKEHKTTQAALAHAEERIAAGQPVAAIVDMFYMKYLPSYLHVHAPFHTILLVGREGDSFAVSDPYSEEIGVLSREDLAAAWETHAPLAKDNFIAYVRGLPPAVPWERAVVRAIRRTCRAMVQPALVRSVLPFVGVTGMRMFARKMRSWPDEHRGVRLREGILFSAVGFEEQGTGGAAFRLMYGAFLQEAADLLQSPRLEELAGQMLEHGNAWRDVSRQLIRLGKKVPMDDDAFADWFVAGEKELREGLREISTDFLARADFEERFFADLKRAVAGLG